MASLNILPSAVNSYSNTISTNNYSTTTSQLFLLNQQKHKQAFQKSLSCRAAKEQEDGDKAKSSTNEGGKFDRRNILLGLGGLYGATAVVSQSAFAVPVDVTKCGSADTLPNCVNPTDCCPPPNPNIIDFTFPVHQPLRVRPAAHLADHHYIDKYNKAMDIMKSLPKDHPHSFAQQAAIHCAYCDSSYQMVGFPSDLKMDVHFSWLFLPFHRWYLYFYEKILGKLIGDPTFAIPYWNWDSPGGMPIPDMFADRNSSLYDKLRDDNHQPPLKIDLSYSKGVISPIGNALVVANMGVMHTMMLSPTTPTLFFGDPYRGGDAQIQGPGQLERETHTAVHVWTGDPNQRYGEDMGRFYSAGRDPLFYSHHANVDRMWNIWKTLPGKNRKDIEDPDWLESAFLFYDENENLVRVKVRDCVDSKKLGFVYQDIPLPWLNYQPAAAAPKAAIVASPNKAGVAQAAEMPKTPPQVFPHASTVLPKVLDKLLKFTVPRPKKSRSKQEKEDEEEILVIQGIEYDGDEHVKFDVYINDEDEVDSGPANAEFAGAFSNVPSKQKERVKASMSLGLTKRLEALGVDDDENVVVALVPRAGKGKVTIGGAKIVISSS